MSVIGTTVEKLIGRRGRDAGSGEWSEVIYRGAEAAVTVLYATAFRNPLVIGAEIDHNGPLWEARIRFSVGASTDPKASGIEDSVRMQINRIQKSIFEPPGPAGITAGQLRTIKKALREQLENATPASFLDAGILPGTNAYELYLLALAGTDYRTVEQPVIYRTRTAAPWIGWPDHNNGVGQNFSTAAMIADADMGTILNFNLPPDSGIVSWANEIGDQTSYAYGWVKHAPHYDVTAGNRSVEYLEYEFGLWPVLLYPLFIP